MRGYAPKEAVAATIDAIAALVAATTSLMSTPDGPTALDIMIDACLSAATADLD